MAKSRKKRLIQFLLLVGTAISLFFVPWAILWAWILPLPDSVQEQLEESISHGFEGAIVYVDQAGKPPGFYTAGWHDRDNKVPARPDALFKIASINKLYDAVAITKLVSAGRLSLDKTLADYFPELSDRIENADKITLRLMVQHRSGIPNYTNTPNFWNAPPETGQEKLALILDMPANFTPDAGYEYSNTNYLLISLIMDKVLGYSHHQYIREAILLPNGLHNTFSSLSEVNIDDVMSGYYVGIEEDIKTTNYGSMLATAEDVGKFLRGLNDGSLFAPGEQDIYSSIYVYEHTGLIPGYQSIAKYHKDIDTVVIQFMNTTDFSGYHWNLSEVSYKRVVKIVRRG